MTGEQEEMIKVLKDRVQLVMTRYKTLKSDYSKMVLENENLRRQVSEQKEKAEVLERQYNSAKLASGVLVGEADKEVARTEINRIVREIDNCIALLNR